MFWHDTRGLFPRRWDVLKREEIESDYEWNTGQAIVRRFAGINPLETRTVLVAGHAPFCWGTHAAEAAYVVWMLEEVAHMAFSMLTINPEAQPLSDVLREKHFLRKHGASAYYGQKMTKKRKG